MIELQEKLDIDTTLFFICLFRVGGIFLIIWQPLGNYIPLRIKAILSTFITFAISHMAALPNHITIQSAYLEFGIGVYIGCIIRLMLYSLTASGIISAQASSFSHLFGNIEPSSHISRLLSMAGIGIVGVTNLPSRVVEATANTYTTIPLGTTKFSSSQFLELIIYQFGNSFQFAITISTPFIAIAFLYNFSLGFMNRIMPQVMMVMIGAPAIAGLSILILLLSISITLIEWVKWMQESSYLEVFAAPL